MRLNTVILKHPLKFVGFTDAAFKDQPAEPIGFALGLVGIVDFIVRRQRRVVRSTFGAEFNGLVDGVEQLILLQFILHQIYCGTHQSP